MWTYINLFNTRIMRKIWFRSPCFNIAHEYPSILQRKFRPNSSACYLQIKFTIKKIIITHKVRHFYDIFSRNRFVLAFILMFPSKLQALIMWNTRIKPYYICGNKTCLFKNFCCHFIFLEKISSILYERFILLHEWF